MLTQLAKTFASMDKTNIKTKALTAACSFFAATYCIYKAGNDKPQENLDTKAPVERQPRPYRYGTVT